MFNNRFSDCQHFKYPYMRSLFSVSNKLHAINTVCNVYRSLYLEKALMHWRSDSNQVFDRVGSSIKAKWITCKIVWCCGNMHSTVTCEISRFARLREVQRVTTTALRKTSRVSLGANMRPKTRLLETSKQVQRPDCSCEWKARNATLWVALNLESFPEHRTKTSRTCFEQELALKCFYVVPTAVLLIMDTTHLGWQAGVII